MSTKFRVPGYCIHTARNQAYVRLNGSMVYLGAPNSPESREKYDRLIGEWMASGRTYVKPANRGGVSVNEILLAYRRYAECYYVNPDGTPAPEVERINLALRPVTYLYGTTPAQEFGPKALQVVREKMIKDGLCRRTINQRIGAVKRCLAWAAAEELIPASVHHGLQALKGLRRGRSQARESEVVKPVPRHVVDAALKCLPPILQAAVQIHELTGMRSGELCIMRTCDIELTNDGKPWFYRPQKHKTMHHGHQRVVPIGPNAQEILRPLLKTDVQAYIFSPAEAQAQRDALKRANRKSPVQPSQVCRKKRHPEKKPGQRYTTNTYRHALQYATEQAIENGDLPEGTHWHPHQLRHNCATRIRKEHGLDACRAVLGHTSVTQSAEYGELDAQLAAETAAAVG